MRRVLIVGYGRMGRLIETLCPEYGMEVAGHVDIDTVDNPDSWPKADVAVDFSLADAVPVNFLRLAARRMDVIIGTTGWQKHLPALQAEAARHPIGVVSAANFALGVNLFLALAKRAAELVGKHEGFGAYIHEAHHAAKADAPSGTALTIEAAMKQAGYARPIDVSSTRAGFIPGIHTIGFDAAGETITLTHSARDRTGFARGALEAARWVEGKRGWFTMSDVLEL